VGVVFTSTPTAPKAEAQALAILPGFAQTVYAGEVWALATALACVDGPVVYVGDNLQVVEDWYAQRFRNPAGPAVRAWRKVADALRGRQGGHLSVTVLFCFSHLSPAEAIVAHQPWQLTVGNAMADAAAEVAAGEARLPPDVRAEVRSHESLARRVRARLLRAARDAIAASPYREHRPTPARLRAVKRDLALRRSAHSAVLKGDVWHYPVRDTRSSRHHLLAWLAGPCRPAEGILNSPFIKIRSEVRLAGTAIHASHVVLFCRDLGLYFCACCGYYACQSVRKALATVCERHTTKTSAQYLARLGRVPPQWPHTASVPRVALALREAGI